MDKNAFIKAFWKSYTLLEKDFLATDEFVSVDKSNFATFSARYTYLFLNICSEMDSLAEEYCKTLGYKNNLGNIVKKIAAILQTDPRLKDTTCVTVFPYGKIHVVPFQSFNEESSAGWWQDYNKVKHFRADIPESGIPNYQRANLKNIINALAALFILSVSLYERLDGSTDYDLKSKLFIIE